MGLIVPSQGLKTLGPMLLPIPSFLLGYSVGMSGPVPGFGGPSSRSHGQELCQFHIDLIVVVVALWGGRGASVTALAAFGRHREMGAVLAGVSVVA